MGLYVNGYVLTGHEGAVLPVRHQRVVLGLAATVGGHVTDVLVTDGLMTAGLVLETGRGRQNANVPAKRKTAIST